MSTYSKSGSWLDPGQTQMLKNLATYSALGGLGMGGLYAISSMLRDKQRVISKLEKLEDIKNSDPIDKPAPPASEEPQYEDPYYEDPQEETSAPEPDSSDTIESDNPELAFYNTLRHKSSTYKSALFGLEDWAMKNYTMGFATPFAVLAPGVATYWALHSLSDKYRENRDKKKVEDAKKEFEAALSKSSSALRDEIDELYFNSKQAGKGDGPTYLGPAPGSDWPRFTTSGGPAAVSWIPVGLGMVGGLGSLVAANYIYNRARSSPDSLTADALKRHIKRQIVNDALAAQIKLKEQDGDITFEV